MTSAFSARLLLHFPVAWERSKIPGFAGSVKVPNLHGFSALMVFSSVAARYFTPQVSGAGAVPSAPAGVFRIDHDEVFNQTTHLQYQIRKGPWFGFNWRYDSGLVAGAVPFATDTTTPVDLTVLSADQQIQAGLFCGNQFPTLSAPLTSCAPSQYGSTLVKIPAPGTENDDKNPPRTARAELVRSRNWRRQSLPWRQTQMERPTDRDQPHEQGGALQLSLHLQRNALRDPASVDGASGL